MARPCRGAAALVLVLCASLLAAAAGQSDGAQQTCRAISACEPCPDGAAQDGSCGDRGHRFLAICGVAGSDGSLTSDTGAVFRPCDPETHSTARETVRFFEFQALALIILGVSAYVVHGRKSQHRQQHYSRLSAMLN